MLSGLRARAFQWRFSLGAMLAGVGFLCMLLAGPANQAHRQREAAMAVSRFGGQLVYRHQRNGDELDERAEPPAPHWLRRLLGDDYFQEATELWLNSRLSDAELDKILAGLPRLRRLVVCGDDVGPRASARLTNMPELEDLVLGSAGFSKADDWVLWVRRCARLRYLGLSHSNLTDIGAERMVGMDCLEELVVLNTFVTERALDSFGKLPNLRRLEGPMPGWASAGAIARFRRSHPGCVLEY